MAGLRLLPSKIHELHKLSRREVVSLFEKLAEGSRGQQISQVTENQFRDDYHEAFDKACCEDRLATKDGRGEFVHE